MPTPAYGSVFARRRSPYRFSTCIPWCRLRATTPWSHGPGQRNSAVIPTDTSPAGHTTMILVVVTFLARGPVSIGPLSNATCQGMDVTTRPFANMSMCHGSAIQGMLLFLSALQSQVFVRDESDRRNMSVMKLAVAPKRRIAWNKNEHQTCCNHSGGKLNPHNTRRSSNRKRHDGGG